MIMTRPTRRYLSQLPTSLRPKPNYKAEKLGDTVLSVMGKSSAFIYLPSQSLPEEKETSLPSVAMHTVTHITKEY